MSRVKVLLSLLLLLGLGANAKGAESPQTALADLPHVSFPAAHRVASGALHASDMAALKQAGVKDVINLRTPAETPAFDEAEAMARAGIEYHSLPIHGAQGLTQDNVRRFDQLLHASGDQLTLVHCASSNRVGAMVALRAGLLQGKTVEQAIAEGQRWGLKSLEPAVRERLQSWSEKTQPDHFINTRVDRAEHWFHRAFAEGVA